MIRHSLAAVALSLAAFGSAAAGNAQSDPSQPGRMGEPKDKPVYVQLIVKACHRAETPLEPTNQVKVYNDEKPMTLEERKAALVALGCIDVPVPMDFLADPLSPSSCMAHGSYLAAMQFLEQRQDIAEFPAVGSWECIITDHEVIGAESM